MKTINKFTLFLLLSCGYSQDSFSSSNNISSKKIRYAEELSPDLDSYQSFSKKPSRSVDVGVNTSNPTKITTYKVDNFSNLFSDQPNEINDDIKKVSFSQNSMQREVSKRSATNANGADNTKEDQLNRLIQQNYKTDTMKYDILALMDQEPFMEVNIITASIENLPTIDEILQQSYEKSIDKKIIINGLKSTLRAINGALADDAYDNQWTFTGGIKTELNTTKEAVSARLKQVDPISYLRYYAGAGALAALAATAAVYYYGITPKDTQDYVTGVGQGLVNSASQNVGSMVNSTANAIGSAASSAINSVNSSIQAITDSASEQIGTTFNSARDTVGSTFSSAAK